MSGRIPAALLAVLLAAGCGESAAAPDASVLDVKGTPFLAPKRKPLPPEAMTIGDTDTARPDEPVVAAAPPAAAVATTAPAAVDKTDKFVSTSFDELAGFDCGGYSIDVNTKYDIPAKILALSGHKVVIDGYMMPLAYEAGGAKKFLLMRYKFGCCYAVAPKINEWIEVTMDGGSVADYIPDTIATVWGVLDIKQEQRDGVAAGLYKIKASKSELTEAR
jgi:hypothetical protein